MKNTIIFLALFMGFHILFAQTKHTLWTNTDVIDNRIDVNAQRSIMRMLKGDFIHQKIASDLLLAVKTKAIEGIYLVDQGVPALRAKSIGKGWWQLVPKGESVALMTKPTTRAPLIVLSKSILSNPAMVDQALIKGWAMLLDTRVEKTMVNYSPASTYGIASGASASIESAEVNDIYPYSPDQLSNLIDLLAENIGWTASQKQLVIKNAIVYALNQYRFYGTKDQLQQFEDGVEKAFGLPMLKEAAKTSVEVELSSLSSFRQTIFRKADSLFALGKEKRKKRPNLQALCPHGLIEGDLIFDRGDVVIDPPGLKKARKKAQSEGRTYTTCIDWQPKLLVYHVSPIGFSLKKEIKSYPLFYGTVGVSKAQSIKAWNEASKDMPKSYRPKPGDVYLLFMKDEKTSAHTGFIKSIRVINDPNHKLYKKEIWTVVDGGQRLGTKQAVLEIERIYDPVSNIINTDPPRGPDGGQKWVKGWVNADRMLKL